MNYYFVMAKIDEHDGRFSNELVQRKYPQSYALVPGYVWVVATDQASSHDVAMALDLYGGNADASGIVVPAAGYSGFAQKDFWNFLDPSGRAVDVGLEGTRPR